MMILGIKDVHPVQQRSVHRKLFLRKRSKNGWWQFRKTDIPWQRAGITDPCSMAEQNGPCLA